MSKHIVVFDSGIGGTSVMSHIQTTLPSARFSYLMDNKYLPYGELSPTFLTQRITSLLTDFINTRDSVDLLVIACNTASTQTLEALRSIFPFPIVGVVPAIKPAAENTQTNKIGLLATPGTVANSYTANLISNFASGCKVKLYGSSKLVKLAEQYFWQGKCDLQELRDELKLLSIDSSIDYLVLGCTHFPILASLLKKELVNEMQLLDSGVAIANRVNSLLEMGEKSCSIKKQPVGYYATAAINQTKLSIIEVAS